MDLGFTEAAAQNEIVLKARTLRAALASAYPGPLPSVNLFFFVIGRVYRLDIP